MEISMPYQPEAQPAAPPAGDAYPDSLPVPSRYARNRRILIFTGVGVAAWLVALVATIPAQVAVPLPDASGTLWHGTAPVDANNRIEWRWAPLRSLFAFGFAVDWEVTGPGSALAGRALLRPGSKRIEDVSGTADGGLLQRIGGFSFACAMRLQVDIKEIRLGGSDQRLEGRVRSDPGVCQAAGGAPAVAVPALALDLQQTDGMAVINLATAGQARQPLLVGGLNPAGHLSLMTTEQGAAVLPFAVPGSGMKIETDL
jgi:hypothetical protein